MTKTDPRLAALLDNARKNAYHLYGMTATLEGDRVVFSGGRYGRHSLAADDVQRVAAHWNGYLEANGLDPVTPGSALYCEGGQKANDRLVLVTEQGQRGGFYGKVAYKNGRLGAKLSVYRQVFAGGRLMDHAGHKTAWQVALWGATDAEYEGDVEKELELREKAAQHRAAMDALDASAAATLRHEPLVPMFS